MNRAEFIVATVHFASERGEIELKDAVRILGDVATILNSEPNADIDESEEMVRIWKEVTHKWGMKL